MGTKAITILKKPTPRMLAQLNHLIADLSLTNVPPRPLTYRALQELLRQKNVFLIIARVSAGKKDTIIGFLTVYVVRIPTGIIAVSEDLLVDARYRKWGIGRLLMEYAVEYAEKKGARHISLRTNPKRIEANKLYEQLGFHRMTTNFFRMNLPRIKN